MKRKILTSILAISLVFSQAIPAFAESPDNVEAEVVSEQPGSGMDESVDVVTESDGAAFTDDADDHVDESSEISEETENIFQSNEEEYESSIDTENGGAEEAPLVDHQEGEKEEVTFNDGDSLPQEDAATFISDGIEADSTQIYAAGNSISSATNISIGNTYSGSISSSNPADFYKFSISSSGNIKLTSTTQIPWVYYRIYNSKGERLWSQWYATNSSGQSSINESLDLTKGIYYLAVEKYSSSYTGRYSFKLSFTSAGESFTETGYGNNNTIAVASNIFAGTTYKGQLAKNDEKDFYKFTISSSGKITLTSTALIPWVYYRIYNSTGERLWGQWYAVNSSGQSSINEVFDLTKGTYYLGVEKYSNSYTGNYSFKLAFTSAGESFTETGYGNNNTIATANSISIGKDYKGQIAKNDEIDFYKFTINSYGKYILSSTATIPCVYYRIYDSTGNQVWSKWYYATHDRGYISVNLTMELTKGVYYFGVEQDSSSDTGTYSFKISPHSHRYTSKVTRATTHRNGKINYECACGATKQSIIYYPKTISLSSATYKYDGKTKKPSVVVKGSNGKIISSSNYTVSYAGGRKKVGTYKVTIRFKGNYSGTVSKTFKINPKATNISKLTARSKGFMVKWRKQKTQVTGYQIQYSTNKRFSGKATKTITKNSITSATYRGLKAKKKYYVRIRTYKTVSGTKYYSSWSPTKTIKTKK